MFISCFSPGFWGLTAQIKFHTSQPKMSAYGLDLNIKFCFQEQQFTNTSVSAPMKQFPQSENRATFYVLSIVRRKLLTIWLCKYYISWLKRWKKRMNNNLFCSVDTSQMQVVLENCSSVKRQWENPPAFTL